MKVTLQETGFAPEVFDVKGKPRVSTQMLPGDKRGVRLSLWNLKNGGRVAELTYLTEWGIERPFTSVFHEPGSAGLDAYGDIDEDVRGAAQHILPPGAGYPAMPQYDTRQAKLKGILTTLTFVALSEVLAQQIDQKSS